MNPPKRMKNNSNSNYRGGSSPECIILEDDDSSSSDSVVVVESPKQNLPTGSDSSSESSNGPSTYPLSTTASTVSGAIDLSPVSIVSSENSQEQESQQFYPFIPDYVYKQKTFNSSVSCLGCGQIFLCQRTSERMFPSGDYFNHCFSCANYANLLLVVPCKGCASSFLNQQMYTYHIEKDKCIQLAERNRLKYNAKTALDECPYYFSCQESSKFQESSEEPKQEDQNPDVPAPEQEIVGPSQDAQKCRLFLSYFLHKTYMRSPQTADQHRILMQDLIDGKITTRFFIEGIEKLRSRNACNYSRQLIDCFKGLDELRQLMSEGKMEIEKINPPTQIMVGESNPFLVKSGLVSPQTAIKTPPAPIENIMDDYVDMVKYSMWRPKSLPAGKYEKSEISCEGCGEEFFSLYNKTKGQHFGDVDYYRHCMKCSLYLVKKKIKHCCHCKHFFLNHLEYSEHLESCHETRNIDPSNNHRSTNGSEEHVLSTPINSGLGFL